MKSLKRLIIFVLSLVITTIFLSACTEENIGSTPDSDPFFSGKWGYIYEPEVTILAFKGNKVEFKGKKYTYTKDDNFLYLAANDEDLKLRYMISGKHFYIYTSTDYEYEGNSIPNELVGKWTSSNKWSFEFKEDGQFIEDGYFPGEYTSDDRTFKLMYTDHFEDTVCYYSLNGKTMTVEYPWEMARAE